ncbi:hypothetical protein MIR68_000131 [Amoeboaphelidium protococcarum]|nr:hypothetical protein MIR68_000131 [Amoeboaphelidium protococcarum]
MTGVVLTELNDYIAPANLCVKGEEEKTGLEPRNMQQQQQQSGSGDAKVFGQIQLQDCLACSGCITSAETVLIQQHQYSELIRNLSIHNNIVVAISPQSRSSLAFKFGLTHVQIMRRLQWFFSHHLPQKYNAQCNITLTDTSIMRNLALIEAYNEYKSRRVSNYVQTSLASPVITSSCPGFICLAEKTLPDCIPYISKVRSPQQIFGLLCKKHLDQDVQYTVSVMPCADKKLEATRPDFADSDTESHDVDLVLTTMELDAFIQEEGLDLQMMTEQPYTPLQFSMNTDCPEFYRSSGSSSGGYLQYIIDRVMLDLQDVSNIQVATLPGKNADIQDVIIVRGNDEILFRGAYCYGLKNIQNIVRSLTQGKQSNALQSKRTLQLKGLRKSRHQQSDYVEDESVRQLRLKADQIPYNYIEIMACPSGCINGGGQIKLDFKTLEEHRQKLKQLEDVYRSIPVVDPTSAVDQSVYHSLLSSHDLLTEYHPIKNTGATKTNLEW